MGFDTYEQATTRHPNPPFWIDRKPQAEGYLRIDSNSLDQTLCAPTIFSPSLALERKDCSLKVVHTCKYQRAIIVIVFPFTIGPHSNTSLNDCRVEHIYFSSRLKVLNVNTLILSLSTNETKEHTYTVDYQNFFPLPVIVLIPRDGHVYTPPPQNEFR